MTYPSNDPVIEMLGVETAKRVERYRQEVLAKQEGDYAGMHRRDRAVLRDVHHEVGCIERLLKIGKYQSAQRVLGELAERIEIRVREWDQEEPL